MAVVAAPPPPRRCRAPTASLVAIGSILARVADAGCPMGYGDGGDGDGARREDENIDYDNFDLDYYHASSVVVGDFDRDDPLLATRAPPPKHLGSRNLPGRAGGSGRNERRLKKSKSNKNDRVSLNGVNRRRRKRRKRKSSKKTSKSKGSAGAGPERTPPFRAAADYVRRYVLTNSRDFWPADFADSNEDGDEDDGDADAATGRRRKLHPHGGDGNARGGGHYGPLFIRLAWHCAGSYRQTDGRGGCDGGRIRFDPELSWEDNANLDKALRLLEPVASRYGPRGLSWADLIILAGNVAIESMGGPILGFCGGRVDDRNGRDSLPLGPSAYQEEMFQCEVNGQCDGPILGPTTVGLIYVNPAGPMANSDPLESSIDIRNTFSRMGMNDSETVSLIGGGHSFGRMHGACPDPPCGDGKGENAFTSGFEGEWTTRPTEWTNQYFENLMQIGWERVTNVANNVQWAPEEPDAPPLTMLTSDIALLHDESYLAEVTEYGSDLSALSESFMHAWYKLTTSDMGPRTRCLGEEAWGGVPPAQPFQHPLPDPPDPNTLPDYRFVRRDIQRMLRDDEDSGGGDGNRELQDSLSLSTMLVSLAYNCASTYRDTDKKGGCNGGRIRFDPERGWHDYEDSTGAALQALQAIKDVHDDVSWADLIVLAGTVALDRAVRLGGRDGYGPLTDFCGGRVDAVDGEGSNVLAPRHGMYPSTEAYVLDSMRVMGLSYREALALAGRPRSMRDEDWRRPPGGSGGGGAWSSNRFFVALRDEDFAPQGDGTYLGDGGTVVSAEEYALTQRGAWRDIIEDYAGNEGRFKRALAEAWTKLMNADRFDGPVRNACESIDTPTF